MADFVIDNSIVMAWCFDDEISTYADDVLGGLEVTAAIAPAIRPLELGNVPAVAEWRKRLNEADSIHFLALIGDLPITVIQEPAWRMTREILALARKRQISTYDPSYLDLAMRKGLPIATRDSGMKKAAMACNVPMYNPARM